MDKRKPVPNIMVFWQDDMGTQCLRQFITERHLKQFKEGIAEIRALRPEAMQTTLRNAHSFFAVRVTMKGKKDG